MIIDYGIQPNCSELIIRLGEYDSKLQLVRQLRRLGVIDIVQKNAWGKKPDNTPGDWDDEPKKNEDNIIVISKLPLRAQILLHEEDIPLSYTELKMKYNIDGNSDPVRFVLKENMDPQDGYGSVWISNSPDEDGLALWGSQHCSENIFPIFKRVSDEYGAEVEAYDGGSLDSYEEWLENQGDGDD